MKYPAFVNGAYRSQSPTADDEVCLNWYVEMLETAGATKNQAALYPTPGVSSVGTATDLEPRGSFTQDGRAWTVYGSTFYECTESGGAVTLVYRGSVLDDGLPVTMCSNGDELLVTSGNHAYIFDLSLNTLVEVASLAGLARMGAYLDGYFIVLDITTATGTIRISGLFDGTTWDATDIANRSIGSDKWIAMAVVNRQIWLFGTQTSEVWYDSGASSFPFQPVPGVFLQYGICASFAWALMDQSPVWVTANNDGSAMVVQGVGLQAQRISTHAVEFALQSYTSLSDVEAWDYQEQGHQFGVFRFPSQSGPSWVYDGSTKLWHQRDFWNVTLGQSDQYKVRAHMFCFNKHLVGILGSMSLYQMSVTLYSDAGGAAIRRVRRAPHLSNELNRVFYGKFQLDLETGIGLNSGQGSDPLVMMRYSNDGGRTWGNQRTVSAGAMGAYGARAIFWNCGSGRDRVFEVSVSDPVPWRIVNAYLELQ